MMEGKKKRRLCVAESVDEHGCVAWKYLSRSCNLFKSVYVCMCSEAKVRVVMKEFSRPKARARWWAVLLDLRSQRERESL